MRLLPRTISRSRNSLSWVTALFLVGLLSVTWVTPAVAAEPKDIVDTAVGAGSFGTLVKAVQAAELARRRPINTEGKF